MESMRRLLMIGAFLLVAAALLVALLHGGEPGTSPIAGPTTSSATAPSAASTQARRVPSPPASSIRSQVIENSSRCRVTGPSSEGKLVEQLAELCEPAAATVDKAWGTAWGKGGGRRTRLVVAADTEDLAGLLDRDDTKGLADTAAVTVGPEEAPAHAVFVNGPAFDGLSKLGRQVVLTHELVHVATRATGDNDAPTWLEEGFADYVAYRDTKLGADQIAGDALDAPLPESLPTTAEFNASGSKAAIAYGRSWAAVRVVAARMGGDSAMKRFYETAAHRGLAAALRSAGFAGTASFVKSWRVEIGQLRRS
jgi:hypothetical protein